MNFLNASHVVGF